jgi:hypothetical protein
MSEEESDRVDAMVLDWVIDYYREFQWIIEVTVPRADEKVSRRRAEVTAQAALDVMKLVFGPDDGEHFRLAHMRGLRDKTAHLMRDDAGEFMHEIARRGEGGFAEEGWYGNVMESSGWVLDAAGAMIQEYLRPENARSNHRDRWLGALSWYGEAVSETSVAGQIVKCVAALERLTVLDETGTTGAGSTDGVADVVTRRTALLVGGWEDAAAVTKAREEARTVYRWRSNLMHGRSSPLNAELSEILGLTHRLTRDVMFATLDLFSQLDMHGQRKNDDLEQIYRNLERSNASGPSSG